MAQTLRVTRHVKWAGPRIRPSVLASLRAGGRFAACSPRTPHEDPSGNRTCSPPDGQESPPHGHMDKCKHLTTCPRCGAPLPTGVRPPGLTRFACLAPVGAVEIFQRRQIPGTCPPAAGWWGVELWGKLRPGRDRSQLGCFPLDLPDGAGASQRGQRACRASWSRVHGLHATLARSRLSPLGGALLGVRSSALEAQPEPGASIG